VEDPVNVEDIDDDSSQVMEIIAESVTDSSNLSQVTQKVLEYLEEGGIALINLPMDIYDEDATQLLLYKLTHSFNELYIFRVPSIFPSPIYIYAYDFIGTKDASMTDMKSDFVFGSISQLIYNHITKLIIDEYQITSL
jgi:hypothetical protein